MKGTTMNAYLKAILERASKTAAQAAILSVGVETTQVNALALDWALMGGMAAGGFVLSVLTSVASSGFGSDGPSLTTERVEP